MKKIKGFLTSLILIVAVVICPLVMTGCTKGKPTLELQTAFKTTYYVGEVLDVSNGVLKYTNNGNEELVDVTESMISGFSTALVGTRNLTITYEGIELEVSYTVNNYITELTVQTEFETEYYKDDLLDVTGGTIKCVEKNLQGVVVNEEIVDVTEAMVSGFSTATTGKNKSMTISYKGVTVQVNYNVRAWELLEGYGYLADKKNEYRSWFCWFNVYDKNELTQSASVVWYNLTTSAAPMNRGNGGNDLFLSFEAFTDSDGYVEYYTVSYGGVTVRAEMISKTTLRVYGTISYRNTGSESIHELDEGSHTLYTLVSEY